MILIWAKMVWNCAGVRFAWVDMVCSIFSFDV
jgi:hypothetical protein